MIKGCIKYNIVIVPYTGVEALTGKVLFSSSDVVGVTAVAAVTESS